MDGAGPPVDEVAGLGPLGLVGVVWSVGWFSFGVVVVFWGVGLVSGHLVVEGFLATAGVVAGLIDEPVVDRRWHEPSALAEMSVGDLAAHLARAVNNVDAYLGTAPAPDAIQVDAAGYFLFFDDVGPDIDTDLNRAVRDRARTESAAGPEAVREVLRNSRRNLGERLPTSDPDGTLGVFGTLTMTVADYLRTRLVEMAVHLDDLATSVEVESPELPPGVADLVVGDLVTMARRRHGDLAVLRALARRERDPGDVLRVF